MACRANNISNVAFCLLVAFTAALPTSYATSVSRDSLGPDRTLETKDIDTGYDLVVRGRHLLTRSFDRSIVTFSYPVDNPTYTDSILIDSNKGPTVIDINHDISSLEIGKDTIVNVLVTVSSYIGSTRIDIEEIIKIYDMDFPVRFYETDFDDGKSDFARYGFNIDYYGELFTSALQSWHPYGSDDSLECIFQKPILVGDHGAIVKYNEILLLEIGGDLAESGVNTDYVSVSASRDLGVKWEEIKRYNSKLHDNWRNNRTNEPNDDLYQEQEIILPSSYSGDTVILKFILHTDRSDHRLWGWSIDDFTVDQLVSVDKPSQSISGVTLSPNPAFDRAKLIFHIDQNKNIECSITDISGREVKRMYNSEPLVAGTHTLNLELSELVSGMYFVTLSDRTTMRSFPLLKY